MMTTQKTAVFTFELMNCSNPHLLKTLNLYLSVHGMVRQPDNLPVFTRNTESGRATELARPNDLFSGHYHRPMPAFPKRHPVDLK
jgi:hypothetical protein